MAAFAGEWVFDLEVAGDQRRYLGPDVVGVGTVWQPGALTGRGLWPRFGYEFESYCVLVAPDRQLTGGFFSLAGRSVADIVGVDVPEASNIEPRLDLTAPSPNPTTTGPATNRRPHAGSRRPTLPHTPPPTLDHATTQSEPPASKSPKTSRMVTARCR